MAGGPNAGVVMCLVCTGKANRVSEGLEDDLYLCEQCGKEFGYDRSAGQPDNPQWPPTAEELEQARSLLALTGTPADNALEPFLRASRGSPQGDLLLMPGATPMIRRAVAGVPRAEAGPANDSSATPNPAPGMSELTPEVTARLARAAIRDEARFDALGEATVRIDSPATGRFRVNVARGQGGFALCIRAIPDRVPGWQALTITEGVFYHLWKRGLVLVAGPARSGKSTTVAAVLEHLCSEREARALTIENPIEHRLVARRGAIVQREVGTDTGSFAAAAEAVSGLGVDLVSVGEIRDAEALGFALDLSASHLVLATVEASSFVTAIQRLTAHPSDAQRRDTLSRLAKSLHLFLSQRLIPHKSGQGLVLALECLPPRPASRALIERDQLPEAYRNLQSNPEKYKTHMNGELAIHCYSGRITLAAACEASPDFGELEAILERHKRYAKKVSPGG